MTTQAPEYSPYADLNSLDTSYQQTVTPAVKVLAALYLAHVLGTQDEQNKPTSHEADVALSLILVWLDSLLGVAKAIFLMPHFLKVADDNVKTFEDTIHKLSIDMTSFRTAPSSKVDGTQPPAVTASQLLLRAQWSLDWVKQHAQSPPPAAATKKIWVSRLDPKTCSTACLKMHGTSVGIDASFTPAALDNGVPKSLLYGSLWGPPIHPNCRCHLIYI